MDKLKRLIYLFLVLIFNYNYGQKTPDITGQYYFGEKQIYLYIFPDNRFVAIGASTVAIGRASIQNNALIFNPIHQKSEYLLYSRKTSGENRLIITDQQIIRNKIYMSTESDILRPVRLTEDCGQTGYFIPFQNKVQDLIVKNNADVVNVFPLDNMSNDLVLFFLEKEQDISELNGIITIKEGHIKDSNLVRRSPLKLGNTTDIEEEKPENILAKFDKIYSIFDQDKIYLNEDYHVVQDKIDLGTYSFNKNKNQYEKKNSTNDQHLRIIYPYVKIKQKPAKELKYRDDPQNFLVAKCLKDPGLIREESNDSDPPLPVQPASQK
ncbi:hypothetical protein AAEU33_00260 [Chryseobacterium sp. Chry.R1]|uniref:hypothetical protein n=1 Tax=Chryseobacterium sp. Chry.R1 TaxID=3139392 RepID=UPI0031F7ABB2